MAQEEKAKRYDEAIEKLRSLHDDYDTVSTLIDIKEELEHIFPELKETKDERIRKEILEYFQQFENEELRGVNISDWIAWLEKQGDVDKKIIQYREYLVSETERWHKAESDKTRSAIGKQDCIGHTNAFISARSEFEKFFNWDTLIEKQGVQKPTDKVEPKFKIEKDKWYICIQDLLDNYANKAFYKGDTYLSTQDGSLMPSNSNVPFEVVCPDTYFRDWTIQDAKDGDVLMSKYGKPFIYNGNLDSFHIGSYCGITTGGSFNVATEKCHWTENENIHPATKEQSDLLFQKMHEAGYEWDDEKKEPKKVEQKPAWSVDDENRFNNLVWLVERSNEGKATKEGFIKFINSLKTLKDRVQPQWRPSSQHIAALEYQVNSTYEGSWQYKASKELLEQLKKL